MRGEEDRLDVDVHHPVELLLVDLEHRPVAVGDASVVDENVDPAKRREYGRSGFVDLRFHRHVGADADRSAADAGSDVKRGLAVEVEARHARAFAGEGRRDLGAKALAGSGHDGRVGP